MGNRQNNENDEKRNLTDEVKVKEPEIEYINIDNIKKEKFEDENDEFKKLLNIKKNNLVYQFDRLGKEIQKKKTIYDLNEIKDTGNDDTYNKEIVQKECCCCESSTYLKWNFNFIGPLFVIFNLVGVFQLINILKATQNEMIFGIKSFLLNSSRSDNNINNKTIANNTITNNNTDEYYSNIIQNFENLCFQNIPDFNVLFLTSAIGNIFLKYCGYRWSTFIFSIINTLIVIFFGAFDFPEEKYDFYSLILIILFFVLLFISVGSIGLFSQQVFFSGLKKYIDIKYDENVSRNYIYFPYLCFTFIPSYLIFLGINYLLRKYFYDEYFISNIIVFASFLLISIAIYQIYSLAFVKSEKKEKEYSKNIYRMCGYVIYCETKSLKNKNNIEKNIQNKNDIKKIDLNPKEDNKDIPDKNEALIIDDNNKDNNDDKNNNGDKIINDDNKDNNDDKDKENNKDNIEIKEKEEESVSCVSCRLGLKKFFRGVENSSILSIIFLCDFNKLCNDQFPLQHNDDDERCDLGNIPFFLMECCNCENKCLCCENCCCFDEYCYSKCCNIWYIFWSSFICFLCSPLCFCCFCDTLFADGEINEFHQDSEDFCYCYKVQRKTSWICGLLFKNNLLEIIVIYIILKLIVIGFEKQIEENLKNNGININVIIIAVYVGCFLIIALINRLNCCKSDENQLQDKLFNLFGITVWNSFLVVIFSGFSLFGSDGLKDFTNNYLILFPCALTKFYYFILMNSLVKDLDSDNLDLLSNSMIISLFLLIYNLIIWLISLVCDISIDILLLFQFIFGIIISLFTIYIIFYTVIYAIYFAMICITCLWIVILLSNKEKKEKKEKKRKKFFFQK